MTPGEIFTGLGILVSLAGVVFVYANQRRANQVSEKKLTVEERAADSAEEDRIAARRLSEIERLDDLVNGLRVELDAMKKKIDGLEKSDREKQKTIDSQADELGRTNVLLSDLRSAFKAFVERVEKAWDDGHSRPSLTVEERALLENTIPRNRIFKE